MKQRERVWVIVHPTGGVLFDSFASTIQEAWGLAYYYRVPTQDVTDHGPTQEQIEATWRKQVKAEGWRAMEYVVKQRKD